MIITEYRVVKEGALWRAQMRMFAEHGDLPTGFMQGGGWTTFKSSKFRVVCEENVELAKSNDAADSARDAALERASLPPIGPMARR